EVLRGKIMPNSTLKGRANLFVMPNLEAANIAYNLVRVFTDGVAIGPILMGISKPVHILTTSATPRRILNMTAIAAVDAQIRQQLEEGRSWSSPPAPTGGYGSPRKTSHGCRKFPTPTGAFWI